MMTNNDGRRATTLMISNQNDIGCIRLKKRRKKNQSDKLFYFITFFPSHNKNSLNLFVTFLSIKEQIVKNRPIIHFLLLLIISFMMCDIRWIIFKLECRLTACASPDFIFIGIRWKIYNLVSATTRKKSTNLAC